MTSTSAPITWADSALMFMLNACKSLHAERDIREGVKDEFIWQSSHLLINSNNFLDFGASEMSLMLLSGSSFEIRFDFRIDCAVRINKTFTKVILL